MIFFIFFCLLFSCINIFAPEKYFRHNPYQQQLVSINNNSTFSQKNDAFYASTPSQNNPVLQQITSLPSDVFTLPPPYDITSTPPPYNITSAPPLQQIIPEACQPNSIQFAPKNHFFKKCAKKKCISNRLKKQLYFRTSQFYKANKLFNHFIQIATNLDSQYTQKIVINYAILDLYFKPLNIYNEPLISSEDNKLFHKNHKKFIELAEQFINQIKFWLSLDKA